MTEAWRARIQLKGVNPFVTVSRARARRLRPEGKRPLPVLVQVNGMPEEPGRVNLVPKGDGSFYLYLNGRIRRASGTQVGDSVEIRVEFDPEYRGGPTHPIPEEFAVGLRRAPTAAREWRALPPSRQKEILRYLAALRSDGARSRNIDRALRVLGGARARFLGRSWNGAMQRSPRRGRVEVHGAT